MGVPGRGIRTGVEYPTSDGSGGSAAGILTVLGNSWDGGALLVVKQVRLRKRSNLQWQSRHKMLINQNQALFESLQILLYRVCRTRCGKVVSVRRSLRYSRYLRTPHVKSWCTSINFPKDVSVLAIAQRQTQATIWSLMLQDS